MYAYLCEAAGPRDHCPTALFLQRARIQILYFLDSGVITSLSLSFSCDFYYIPDTHVRCSLACALARSARCDDRHDANVKRQKILGYQLTVY